MSEEEEYGDHWTPGTEEDHRRWEAMARRNWIATGRV
jgi:hypothetical protein